MQPGFFDHQERLELLERLGDPLPKPGRSVDWEAFRPLLESLYKQSDPRKGGRPPFDAVLMFKVLVLQDFYKLADDQTEFQIRDRYSFCRFLGLAPEGRVPDAKTVWLFRERVKQAQLIKRLFEAVLVQIEAAGLAARKGQIGDAARFRYPGNVTPGMRTPALRGARNPRLGRRTSAARRMCRRVGRKKHGKSHYGYKNPISVDRQHKVIRKYAVSSAKVHDSQVFGALLDEHNSSADVRADPPRPSPLSSRPATSTSRSSSSA
jgi:IS5 family transposase